MFENDQPPKATGSPKAAARSRADGQISAGSDPDAGGEVGVVQPGGPGAVTWELRLKNPAHIPFVQFV